MKRSIRPPEPPFAAEAARLGEELRDARTALGLSIEDLAATLRIRRAYLAALEDGRVRDLPAPAYAVGFVRSYAKALGLDDAEVARRFRDGSAAVVQRKIDLVFPEPVPERGVPAGALVLAGAVAVIGAYVGWWHWSGGETRTVDAVPPPPPRLEELAAAAGIRDGAFPGSPPEQPVPQPPAPAPTAAAAATAPLPGFAAQVRPAAAPVPPPAAASPAPAAAAPAPAPRPAEEGRVVLRAKAIDVWFQVRERASGPVLVDRVLRPGESYAVPAREGLVLSTGNAGGFDVMVDGRALPAGFGPGQPTRRNIPLDPDRLVAAGAAPPAAATPPAAAATPAAATPAAAGPAPVRPAGAAQPAASPAPAPPLPTPPARPAAAAPAAPRQN